MQSDEDLRNELKKYGETSLGKINDKNRDIFIKKLNHYRAREKLEMNESKKQAKKRSTPFNHSLFKNENEDNRASLNQSNDCYEYVQMNNAHTSPLSSSLSSTYAPNLNSNHNDDNDIILLDNPDSTPPKTPAYDTLGVKQLKEKIEFEKFIQKYRSDISNILETSKIRARANLRNSKFNDDVQTDNIEIERNDINIPLLPSSRRNLNGNSHSLNENSKFKVKFNTYLNSFNLKFNNFMKNSFDWSLKLWKLLPYIVFVIFIIVLLQYTRMKMNANNYNLSKFLMNKNSHVQEMYCADIKDTKCTDTKLLVRDLIDYLRVISGNVDCGRNYDDDNQKFLDKCVHYDDVAKFFEKKNLIRNPNQNLKQAMNSVIEAIFKHPHWNLKLYNSSFKETNDLNEVLYFTSVIPLKSVSCRLREMLHTFSMNVLIFILICTTAFLAYLIIKVFHKHHQQSKKTFYELISQVVGLVEKQYEMSVTNPNIKPYIAISHVYDTLIDHSQRASQKTLWSQVVKFLADHESRIRVETQLINGEETLVWRWIIPVNLINPSLSTTIANTSIKTNNITPPRLITQQQNEEQIADLHVNEQQTIIPNENLLTNNIGWQGDAFNRHERLLVSPTPCLKIRNMFDTTSLITDPNCFANIHNAILSKCANVHSIIHIACDKKSKEGCVYVKFNNNEAAGKAYTILNNTWFNGKLLNVKFLREDRYLERFPESANYILPLKPIQI